MAYSLQYSLYMPCAHISLPSNGCIPPIMKRFTDEQVRAHVTANASFEESDCAGQIVVYTSLFKWLDGSIRDEPDPTWNE